jgi:hypothetical protein
METIQDEELPRSRLAVLLKHFSQIEDGRQSWRLVSLWRKCCLLLTCATIADCDDFDEIVAWGRITWIFYDGSRHFILGSRVPAGCGRWSTVSIRCCSGAVSRAGSRNSGPAGMI